MKWTARQVLLLWAALMLGGMALVWQSRFTADMSFFLPANPSPEQQVLVSQLQDGTVSRLLMLALSGANPQQRAELSREVQTRLSKNSNFVVVNNGQASGLDGELNFFLRHRYALSPTVAPERFTVPGLRTAVGDTLDTLASPLGAIIKPHLARDPTGELLSVVEGLNPSAQPNVLEGVWASRDGQRALLLMQTRALGADLDAQEQALALVRQTVADAAKTLRLDGIRTELSGPAVFAVQSRSTIKEEVSRLVLLSTVGILLVLFWVFRSPRLLALGLVPMLSGALAGAVVVSVVHGTVFAITLGFGSALIGEAVDYAIYFFVQSSREGKASWRRSFWPTIRLGVMTSVIGFAALLFTGFPGLSQLGLYALSGVATAALVTRFVLPTLAGDSLTVPAPSAWVQRLLVQLGHAHRLRWPLLVLAVVAAVVVWQQRDQLWANNLSALSTVSLAEAQTDSQLRADLAAPDARYLVLAQGASAEAALQTAERVGQRLDAMVQTGAIGGYDTPVRFLPSAQTQQARLASLPEPGVLRERLSQALQGSPLSASKLQAFLDDVQAARAAGMGAIVKRGDLDGQATALAVDAMLTQSKTDANAWTVVLPLRPPDDRQRPDIRADEVRAALEGSGALFVDMKSEFDGLYGSYLSQALVLSLAGLGAIVLLLAFSLRSAVRLGRVLLALALSVLLVVAGLRLAGEPLHLLHLVGILLVVAVGSNYALFFDRAAGGEAMDAHTLLSLLVATLTTVIGFGVLATSSVPILRAIGITVGPGALLSLLLAAVLVYPPAPRSAPQAAP